MKEILMKQLTNVLSRSWPDTPGGLWIQSESDFDPHSCRKKELQCDIYITQIKSLIKRYCNKKLGHPMSPQAAMITIHETWFILTGFLRA